MEIHIKNCNSIDEARIQLETGRLNIKYGVNGTGKSTIAKAIALAIQSDQKDLSSLTPFKHVGKEAESDVLPSIEGISDIKSVAIFNDSYINSFVFKQDEIVANSFEIFIKTNDYIQKMEEIDALVSNIKETFKSDVALEQVIRDLGELENSFGKPSKKGLHGSAPINKAFGKTGNKVKHVPERLKAYTPFLQSQSNVKWIGWQMQGNDFLDISNDCPYCTSPTPQEKKDAIQAVSKEYDKKSIEHLNGIIKALDSLGKYFSNEAREQIQKIVNDASSLSIAAEGFLKSVWNSISTLKNSLTYLRDLSFYSLKNDENIENKVKELKIDLSLIPHMGSDDTKRIVNKINSDIDEVIKNIGLLKGQINQQKRQIQQTIQRHKKDINDFLKYAGYQYSIDIEEDADSYKMRLKHNDNKENITNSSQHLSYGEKNAFALVMFMYDSLSKNPDLIILDDPISSFDKNKKFAIIEMLFRRPNSLKDKTVLMMTHDLEPIIDVVSTLRGTFQPLPSAYFMRNKLGLLSEQEIEKDDLLSFASVCTQNIQGEKSDVIKLVHLRRYYEILNNKGNEYHILSSLLHKRAIPTLDKEGTKMEDNDIKVGTANIRTMLANFDYSSLYSAITNEDGMLSIYRSTENNYEKLQIYRIITDGQPHENSVIQKFINETFHIENEYIMQLNPLKYDFIPDHVIQACDEAILSASETAAA